MNILLGVSGSIAAYKTYDLVRSLYKQGHKVKVVLTKGALEFIHSKTFLYLGAEDVYLPHNDFSPKETESKVLHVELSNWADRIVIAPASANTISSLAQGMANDLLQSILLVSWEKEILLFPAMNSRMLSNPLTEKNIKKLSLLPKIQVFGTKSGTLVCDEEGEGKLLDLDKIIDVINYSNFHPNNKSVLITTGASKAHLDPVRYLTNPSSGKTGYEISTELLKSGFSVTLLAGKNSVKEIENLTALKDFELVYFDTNLEIKEFLDHRFNEFDFYISSAALTDIEFDFSKNKLKKNSLHHYLKANKAIDCLAHALSIKDKQKIIGFAAETNLSDEMINEKMKRKPVDLLVANPVNSGAHQETQKGFQTHTNDYLITDGAESYSNSLSKKELAQRLARWMDNGQIN